MLLSICTVYLVYLEIDGLCGPDWKFLRAVCCARLFQRNKCCFLKTGEFYSTYETKASTRTDVKTYLFSLLLKNVRWLRWKITFSRLNNDLLHLSEGATRKKQVFEKPILMWPKKFLIHPGGNPIKWFPSQKRRK